MNRANRRISESANAVTLGVVLRHVHAPINRFFTDVLVMADDPAVRQARLALVQRIARLAGRHRRPEPVAGVLIDKRRSFVSQADPRHCFASLSPHQLHLVPQLAELPGHPLAVIPLDSSSSPSFTVSLPAAAGGLEGLQQLFERGRRMLQAKNDRHRLAGAGACGRGRT